MALNRSISDEDSLYNSSPESAKLLKKLESRKIRWKKWSNSRKEKYINLSFKDIQILQSNSDNDMNLALYLHYSEIDIFHQYTKDDVKKWLSSK